MGDIGDYWREAREEKQTSKWEQYDRNSKALRDSGVTFTEKDNGHFIVGEYDFWGTTGLFIHRKTKKRGRGVDKLLALVGGMRHEDPRQEPNPPAEAGDRSSGA